MPLATTLKLHAVVLSDAERRRIDHHLAVLERRLVHRPEPAANLVLTQHRGRRQVEADLRVRLGPLGNHLISKQLAETADRAVRLAVEDLELPLERKTAVQRGEPTFNVPSRRLPASARPALQRTEDQSREDGTMPLDSGVSTSAADDARGAAEKAARQANGRIE